MIDNKKVKTQCLVETLITDIFCFLLLYWLINDNLTYIAISFVIFIISELVFSGIRKKKILYDKSQWKKVVI